MLRHFIAANREEIVSRTRAKVSTRPWPAASTDELQHGVPLFLTQLSETLRLAASGEPFPGGAIGATGAKQGGEMLMSGFTVWQVVHCYGDICQAITEAAVGKGATISPEEFYTLDRCLDTAIAEVVTEYARLKDEAASLKEAERLGQVTHELRNQIQTALLSFQALKCGRVAISGSTGAALGRALAVVRDLSDAVLSEVPFAATTRHRDRVSLRLFLDEVAVVANLHADYGDIRFAVEPVDPTLAVMVDSKLLFSALMNLLHNAFNQTRAHGQVTLRTRVDDGRVLIEVEDHYGGTGRTDADLFRPLGPRRGNDRSDLGIGLSTCREAVKAIGGQVRTRKLRDEGCIFAIELPLAPQPGVPS